MKTSIPESEMKMFALSMIFSLAVILCEQQTLFAPHYTDFGGKRTAVSKVQSAALPWHRGIPAPNESMLNTAEGGLSDTVDGLIAIIALAATETGIIDPYFFPKLDTGPIDPADYPKFGGQEGEDMVDLWSEFYRCPVCKGAGNVAGEACHSCKASGWITK